MRKLFISFMVVTSLLACGSNAEKKEEKQAGTADITADPDYGKGLALVADNKCMVCHKINEPLTGPPYADVAKKYAGYPDTIVRHLARRVIKGGNGVWGQVFMIAHPNISQEDAEAMVKYILLLKSN